MSRHRFAALKLLKLWMGIAMDELNQSDASSEWDTIAEGTSAHVAAVSDDVPSDNGGEWDVEADVETVRQDGTATTERGEVRAMHEGQVAADPNVNRVQPNPRVDSSIIYCSRCGSPNSATARFCDACGSPLATFDDGQSPTTSGQRSQSPSYGQQTGPSGTGMPSSRPAAPMASQTSAASSTSGGKGTGALVCGILSIVFSIFFLSIVGLILGIVGAVMASNAKKAGVRTGVTTGATVTSIIGLVLSIIGLVSCTIVGGVALNYGLANLNYFL